VFDSEYRVLLIRRGQAPNQGMWSVPGGKQQANESLVEACVREIKEETGLVTEVESLIAVVERRLEGFHYVITDFLALPVSGASTRLKASTDVTEACWVGMDKIKNYRLVEGLEIILRKAHASLASSQPTYPGLLPNNRSKTDFVLTNEPGAI